MNIINVANIDYSSIRHPDDEKTINLLNKIPGFKSFLKNTVGKFRESYNEVEYTGNGYDVNFKSMPELYSLLKDTARILGAQKIPSCSTDWYYGISSFTMGDKNPRIILQSGTIELLSPSELRFVFGHELGHLLCGHKPYHMLLEVIYSPFYGEDLAMKAIAATVKLPLMEWYRNSDYSADRVGLLACQDLNVALTTMIKMAGLPQKYYNDINVKAFIDQVVEFEKSFNGKLDTIAKRAYIKSSDFPLLVHRAANLLEWYQSGEYSNILANNKRII